MKLVCVVLVLFAVACPFARAQLAYDEASDSAYAGGWVDGSNGGLGFTPWLFYNDQSPSHFSIGDSTGGGQHGGINTAGQAFSMLYIPFDGISASRNFTSAVVSGQQFGIDILHQGGDDLSSSQLDVFCVNGNGMTCGITRDQAYVAFFGVESFTFSMPTQDGIHLDVAPLASGRLSVAVRSLSSGQTSFATSSLNNYGNLSFFDINRTGSGIPDQTFVNHLSVTAVPEPSSLAALGLGLLAWRRKGRHRNG